MNKFSGQSRKLGQYCLKCFADLLPTAEVCAVCGRRERPHEGRVYWNLHPSLIRLQRFGTWALFFLGVGSFFLVTNVLSRFGIYLGRGSGGLTLICGFMFGFLAQSLSMLTRHRPSRISLHWPGFFGFTSLFLICTGDHVWAGIPLLLALLSIWIRKRFRAWKGALVAGEMKQSAVEIQTPPRL